MEIKKYEVILNNKLDIVFNELFDKEIYLKWTKVFAEGSMLEGDIKQDGIVYFLDKDKNGMKGIVKEYKLNEKVVFNYLSNIIDGKEEHVEDSNNYESYTFSKINNDQIKIEIELGLPKEYIPYMEEMWPKAIDIIKEIFNK